MKRVWIRFHGVKEINQFVIMLQRHDGEFDLRCGKYVVDAKSLLGIFSLDTSGWLEFVIYQEDATIMEDLKPYQS